MDLKLEDFPDLHVPGACPMDVLIAVCNFAVKKYEVDKYEKSKSEREEYVKKSETDRLGLLSAKNERLIKEKAMKKPIPDPLDGLKKQGFEGEILLVSSSRGQSNDGKMNALKRSQGISEDDVDLLNQKKSKVSNEKRIMMPKLDERTVPNPLPELPEELQNRIQAVGGTDVGIVIQKCLTATDINTAHCRLSIPFGKIGREFLREEEKQYLANQNAMAVQFFEPSLQVDKMMLRRWDMSKHSGKTSSMYVLRTHWNSAVAKNHLREDDVIQLWSFRVGAEEQLCLALSVANRGGRAEGQRDEKLETPTEEVAAGEKKSDVAVAEADVGFAGKSTLQSSDVESNQS